MENRTPQEITTMPLSKKEEKNRRRKMTGFNVFVLNFVAEFRNLPVQEQEDELQMLDKYNMLHKNDSLSNLINSELLEVAV